MRRRRLLILGGSRYYSKTIDAARGLDLEVIVTDRDPDAWAAERADHFYAVDITDSTGTLRVAQQHRIDGILALNDFGVPTASFVAKRMDLPRIPEEVARVATDKVAMRTAWERAGVPGPRFRTGCTVAEVAAATEALNRWPLIVKPADSRGGGSRGVTRVDSPAELPAAVRYAQSFYTNPEVIVEEFVEGLEHSVETLSFDGETRIIAIGDKVKTPFPYRVDHSVIYPTALGGDELHALSTAVVAAVKALGIRHGAAHVELCTTPDGPYLFELGARPGGGGTPEPIARYVSGIPVIEEIIRLALGEAPRDFGMLQTRGCVYRFLIPRPGRMAAVHGLDEVRSWPGILDCDVLAQPGSEIRPVRTGADRAGFIIAGAATRPGAIELADRAEARLRFEYE